MAGPAPKFAHGEEHLARVRRLALALPGSTEKISRGEPTFFVAKRVFVMFANNHPNDGRIAVWLAASPGEQAVLIGTEPAKFFKPPYVGVKGWLGIQLDAVDDDELGLYITQAWRLIAPKKLAAPRFD